jgi:hypothetical protein
MFWSWQLLCSSTAGSSPRNKELNEDGHDMGLQFSCNLRVWRWSARGQHVDRSTVKQSGPIHRLRTLTSFIFMADNALLMENN